MLIGHNIHTNRWGSAFDSDPNQQVLGHSACQSSPTLKPPDALDVVAD